MSHLTRFLLVFSAVLVLAAFFVLGLLGVAWAGAVVLIALVLFFIYLVALFIWEVI